MPIDDYEKQVRAILQGLGVDEGMPAARGLVLWRPPAELAAVGLRPNGTEFLLTPAAGEAWRKMARAAADDNIPLHIVSAYRGIEHQAAIIRRKLGQGMALETILKVLAPPGYSEHHGGNAIDIGGADCLPLDEAFETSPAYRWLTANAHRFDFFLSFPRDNVFGYVYEPWHWRYIAP